MEEQKIHYIDFYFQRFFSSTIGWRDDEVGAYFRLLMKQAMDGHIPKDPREIARLITTFKKNWPRISEKFEDGDIPGTLQNNFMKKTRAKAMAKVEANCKNGKMGGRPRKQIEIESKPMGFENKTDGLATENPSPNPTETQPKAIPVTSNQEPIKEKIEKEKGDWKYYPGPDLGLELLESEVTLTAEFIFRLKQTKLSDDRIADFWRAFCLTLTGEVFYQSRSKVVQHFRNWLKSQDINATPAVKTNDSFENIIQNRTQNVLDKFN